jgi:hypothetical protein
MTDERTAYGAPLDPEDAALLAALRARGLNELADMALHCIGESYGHAPTALREFEAALPPLLPAPAPEPCAMAFTHYALTPGVECPSCRFIAPELPPENEELVSWPRALAAAAAVPRKGAMTSERIALLRLHQRSMALDEPDPMVPVTSADLLALLDAAERVVGQDARAAERAKRQERRAERATKNAAKRSAEWTEIRQRDAENEAQRKLAEARCGELGPAFSDEFRRNRLVTHSAMKADPCDFAPEDAVKWFSDRGVVVEVAVDPTKENSLLISPRRLIGGGHG